jgi:hypothetical protein
MIPRIRTIGVRMREDEYAALEKYCAESGANSIAEVTRSAISAFIREANRKNVLASNASRNAIQMKDLHEKLERLSAQISALKRARSSQGLSRIKDADQGQKKTTRPSSSPSRSGARTMTSSSSDSPLARMDGAEAQPGGVD